jgi:hypothetical protein
VSRDRAAWNDAYIKHMMEVAHVEYALAKMCAECDSSDDAFNDGDSPEDAVDNELSCWGD